jgi:hypothetical protein
MAFLIAWLFDFQLHVQSVPVTTKVVSSNPARWFFRFPPPIKVSFIHCDTIERLLKVAINILTLQYDSILIIFH